MTFLNGGSLSAEGFRVDVPGPDVSEDEVAALFVASLSLLMVDQVEVSELSVFEEPHKGTRGGPSDLRAQHVTAVPCAGSSSATSCARAWSRCRATRRPRSRRG